MKKLLLITLALTSFNVFAFGNQGQRQGADLGDDGYFLPSTKYASTVMLFGRTGSTIGNGAGFRYASDTSYQVPSGKSLRVFYTDCDSLDNASAINSAGLAFGDTERLGPGALPAGTREIGEDGAANRFRIYQSFRTSALTANGTQRQKRNLNFIIPENKYVYLQLLSGGSCHCTIWGIEE